MQSLELWVEKTDLVVVGIQSAGPCVRRPQQVRPMAWRWVQMGKQGARASAERRRAGLLLVREVSMVGAARWAPRLGMGIPAPA